MKTKLGNLVAGCVAAFLLAATESASAISANVDLAITKIASTNSVPLGQQMQFFLTLSNAGPGLVASAVTVSDRLPAGFQYVSSAGNGSYNSGTGLWTVVPGTAGTANLLTITAQAVIAGFYTNIAAITTLPPGFTDTNLNNNAASAAVLVTSHADLGITVNASTDSALVGDTVTFTVSIENSGPDPVKDAVTTVVVLPSGLTLDNVSGDGVFNATTGTWTAAPGAAGNVISLTVVATINATGSLGVTAVISELPAGVTDGNPNNDSAQAVVTASEPQVADLAIVKTANTNSLRVGEQILFTLQLVNNGPADETGKAITVTDILPPGFAMVSATGDGAYDATTGRWTVSGQPSGLPGLQLIITAQATTAGLYTNTAAIASEPPGFTDPVSSNNLSSVTVLVKQSLDAKAVSIGGVPRLLLSWPASLGVELRASETLAPGSWMTVTDMVTIANGEKQLIVSPTNAQMFFLLANP